MNKITYRFDDEFFRQYHKDHPDVILKGENDIDRTPACWSPYFWIMVKTWQDARAQQRTGPYEILQSSRIDKEILLWNRHFCAELSSEQKRKYNIGDIEPLELEENKTLLDYINENLEKLGQKILCTLSDLPKEISFSDIHWNDDMIFVFQRFIFPETIRFQNGIIDITANFSRSIFLDEVNFTGTKFLKRANFRDSQFSKKVSFIGSKFSQEAKFEDTTFEADVLFSEGTIENCIFHGQVDFSRAKFQGYTNFFNIKCVEHAIFFKSEFSQKASFSRAHFQGKADFRDTKFKEKVSFSKAIFQGAALFMDTKFEGDADFGAVTFQGVVNFSTAPINDMPSVERFYKDVCFKKANFGDNALFFNIIIGGEADFDSAYFDKCTNFKKVQFKNQAIFKNAQFRKDSTARFDGMTCKGEFNFSNVDCHPRCFFTGADWEQANLNFTSVHFHDAVDLDEVKYPKQAGKKETDRIAWCNIRNAMKSEDDVYLELDLFARELEVRQHTDKNYLVRFMIAAYGFLADYGRSVFKPVVSLLIVFVVFSMIHTMLAGWPLTAWLFIVFPVCLSVYCYVHNHIVAITKFCNHKITSLISKLSKIKAKVRSCQRSISRTIYRVLGCRFCQQKYRHLKNMLYKNKENLWKISVIGLVLIIFIRFFNCELYSAAFNMSFYDTTTFLKLSTTASSIFDKLYDQADGPYYVIIMFVRMMHKIIVIALLALLANSIRNHLRMR